MSELCPKCNRPRWDHNHRDGVFCGERSAPPSAPCPHCYSDPGRAFSLCEKHRPASAPPAEQPGYCSMRQRCINDGEGGTCPCARAMQPAPQDTTDGVAEALQRRLDECDRGEPTLSYGGYQDLARDAIAEVRRLRERFASLRVTDFVAYRLALDTIKELDTELARLRAAANKPTT